MYPIRTIQKKDGAIMIKHVVMWKLKESANGCSKHENAKKIKALLEALPAKIEQIKYLKVGIDTNISADNRTSAEFDACLITMFDNMEDLDIYQNNPDHKQVSAFVAEVRKSRAVVDFEV